MALSDITIESYVESLIKRAQGQGHTSELFGLYEDPAPRSGAGSTLPSHPILHANQIIGDTLTLPPPDLGHLGEDGIIKQFGNQFVTTPCVALLLTEIATVGDSRAWIAVQGNAATTDEPWAFKAPGVGFLDSWVNGDAAPAAVQNANGESYKARFWWGDPEPINEIDFAVHPSKPFWDPSTGILVWAKASPYASIIAPGSSLWFTGYLYIGNTVKDLISLAGGSSNPWTRVVGCVNGGTAGVGTLGVAVTYDLTLESVHSSTALVFQNGVLLKPTADYIFPTTTSIRFTQTRRPLAGGDEIQVQYEVSA
jgi:hypothetical protein